MIYSNLLKSTALIAGLTNALTHYKTGESNLVKRATELGNSGIYYDIVEDGLSTEVTFSVDYDEVIIVKGYVVSTDFTLTASDSGFAVTATYDNATQFCEDADKWMMVYSYDDSTPALIAPDCDNYFTLLDADGSVVDWKAGGCISIGSLAAANPACASVSASSTAVTASSSAEPTTYTEIVITETVSGTVTDYTTYCPLTSGSPDYSALSTSVVTVSNGVTTTVTIPCSACAAKASSAVSASSAAAAAATTTGTGSGSGLYVETTYVSGTVTVTSYVPCSTAATGATATGTTVGTTGATEATGATGATEGTTATEAATEASSESTVYSTVYTTYSTSGANGETSVVTSAVATSAVATTAVPAASEESTGSSTSAVAAGSASGSATASVLEGGASIKLASSGLIAAAIAALLM